MSDFFDSEMVQDEIEEINDLQKEVFKGMTNILKLTDDERNLIVEKLELLLDKQKIMYARLCLSDDTKAIEVKKQFQNSVQLMGFPKGTSVNTLFEYMSTTINTLRDSIDV